MWKESFVFFSPNISLTPWLKYYEKEYNILKTNGVLIIEIYRNIGDETKLATKIVYPNTIKISGDKKKC